MLKQFMECGRIVTTHGIRGEVKLDPWSNTPEELARIGTFYLDARGEKPLRVENARVQKTMLLLKLAGYDTPEDALALRGRIVYLNRDDDTLPEGQCYVQDLIGLVVLDADTGERYGEVCDVTPTGANDVYHVRFADGTIRLAPAIPQVVQEVDLVSGILRIRPLPGLFED